MIQLRIVLLELRPNVWRRVVLPDCPLARLPYVVTRVFQENGDSLMVAGDHWQCDIHGVRIPPAENDRDPDACDPWSQPLHTALHLGKGAAVGKFRMICDGRWTFLLIVEQVVEGTRRQADCAGGWGAALPLQESADFVLRKHRQYICDSLQQESAEISREIATLERELDSGGRGSRRWEEQWSRMRGEDDWADQLAERRRSGEVRVRQLEHRLKELRRSRGLNSTEAVEHPVDGDAVEPTVFPFSFDV